MSGLYLPPVLRPSPKRSLPPQTIISPPVQTPVCKSRPVGALVVLVAVQTSVFGLYFPPVFIGNCPAPPQTIISLLVHTAVCTARLSGVLPVLIPALPSSVW